VRCDVRVIAATHRNLEENIIKGSFREDLFYRLNVFPIEMPPLRERIDDLQLLIEDITTAMDRNGHGSVRFSADAMSALRQYAWPGNVRELHNLIERLAVLHPRGLVQASELPLAYRRGISVKLPSPMESSLSEDFQAATNEIVAVPESATRISESQLMQDFSQLPPDGVDLKDHIANIELRLIKQALCQANGVVAHAAKLLNTRRTTLVEKLRKYGLQRDDVGVEASAEAGDGELREALSA
jgi:sigma-54 specific flagellar transcriptional regulator A